jgi:DNA-binding transcriptional ArsR family regulator
MTDSLDRLTRAEHFCRSFYEATDNELMRIGWYPGLNASRATIVMRITDGMSVHEVNENCFSGQNVTYNLDRLEEEGYITRTVSNQDGRIRIISLTKKGSAARAHLRSALDGVLRRLPE